MRNMVFSFRVAVQREPHEQETVDAAVPKGSSADHLPIWTRSGADLFALQQIVPRRTARCRLNSGLIARNRHFTSLCNREMITGK
jgi:hypothetical protein